MIKRKGRICSGTGAEKNEEIAMALKESEILELKKSTSELKEAIISVSSILNKHQKGEIYFYMGETPDKRDEILDYDWSKPNLLKWLFNNKQ